MTLTWEDGTEPLVGGGLVQAGKVDRQVRAALAAAKEVQPTGDHKSFLSFMGLPESFFDKLGKEVQQEIGCVGHDCAECRAREAQPRQDRRPDGMLTSRDERHLRRLLGLRSGIQGIYHDDGEMYGQEGGISIDFMRDPVDEIDSKMLEMGRARLNAQLAQPQPADSRIAALEAKCADYEATLNSIASWNDGPIVANFFDEPSAASEAREVLAKHGGTA